MDSQLNLNRILEPEFQMLHGPAVEQIAFLSITVLPAAQDETLAISFLADIPNTVSELHQRIAEHTPLEYLSVHHLEMEISFSGCEIEKAGRRVYCELTAPDQHNLTDEPHHQQIWQLLLSWGLYAGKPYAAPTRPARAK